METEQHIIDRSLISADRIEEAIYMIRGRRVILDYDLARLYGVSTTRLNEQVKRNRKRFPNDFMFRLTDGEFVRLMSQIAISNLRRGGRRKLPFAFTEHGVVMLASVLNSSVAVDASIHVVRAFVQLRTMVATHSELLRKLKEIDEKIGEHDTVMWLLFEAIKQLMESPSIDRDEERPRIGFIART
ncbi:MAG: hypothetical protein UY09_C0028G0013 [Parcubacteria group bacterium GW2011_GWA2_47_8]|nr:MAG: hypothetical protein UY09_C0028G0013 [Parcubacteria group bacterium GW2011_GWA2_47_8]